MYIKLSEVIDPLRQVMMIFRKKMKKMTFEKRKTKLRPSTLLKLGSIKLKRAYNRPEKRKKG